MENKNKAKQGIGFEEQKCVQRTEKNARDREEVFHAKLPESVILWNLGINAFATVLVNKAS